MGGGNTCWGLDGLLIGEGSCRGHEEVQGVASREGRALREFSSSHIHHLRLPLTDPTLQNAKCSQNIITYHKENVLYITDFGGA